ncbi:Imm50 family immunity protein [Streptomyces spinosirectus]
MGADWRRLLDSAGCRLFHVHFDEREDSATLGFETREFPVNPLQEWVEKGLNAFEFYVAFTGVTDLRVTGWGWAEAQRIEVVAVGGGQAVNVSLGSETSGIAFRASAVRLAKSRAYLASDSE